MSTGKPFAITLTAENDRRYRVDVTAMALHLVQSVSDFGEYARQRREFLNLSQQLVAKLMKEDFYIPWHQTVVAKIESGERQVKLSEALALSFLYGMTLDDLVMGVNLTSTDGLIDLTGVGGDS